MLAYAAGQPRIGARGSSPKALLLIIGVHVVAIALIVTAKATMQQPVAKPGPTVISIPLPKPPPPRPVQRAETPRPEAALPQGPTEIPPLTQPQMPVLSDPVVTGADSGNSAIPELPPLHLSPAVPASSPAQPLTSASDLRPPYPQSKLLAGEEASLTLRLTIDEHGRVVAVEPVGRADPIFLAAARRHLIARWHYKPAMQAGRPVSSTAVVTLRFELDG